MKSVCGLCFARSNTTAGTAGHSQKRRGISLVELLVSLTVIAILAVLIWPSYSNARPQAQQAVALSVQGELNSTYSRWISLGGKISGAPTTQMVLSVLTSNPGENVTVSNYGNGSSGAGTVEDSGTSNQVRLPANIAGQLSLSDIGDAQNVSYYQGNYDITFNSDNGSFTVSLSPMAMSNTGSSSDRAGGLSGCSHQPLSLTGKVFQDDNDDGMEQPNEHGIQGVTMTLTGTQSDANQTPVNLSTATAKDGSFAFKSLLPGTYTIAETQPTGYLPGKETAGSLGGTISSNTISNIPLKTVNNSSGVVYMFGNLLPASISGTVFVDDNDNGAQDNGEEGLAGVAIALTGTDDNGESINLTTSTNANGGFSFTNLRPGLYQVSYTVPVGYSAGLTTAGNQAGSGAATSIGSITLNSGNADTGYNFAVVPNVLNGNLNEPAIVLGGNLNFGAVLLNTTATSTLRISNSGSAALHVTSITLPSGFTANWTSGSIAAGSYQDVTISFAPTVEQSYSGTLTVNSNATSGVSSATITAAGMALPQAPSSLTVTNSGNNEIDLGWTINGNPGGFIIERQQDGGAWVQLAVLGAGISSYADKTATGGSDYAYRIIATNAVGESAASKMTVGVGIPSGIQLIVTPDGAVNIYNNGTLTFSGWPYIYADGVPGYGNPTLTGSGNTLVAQWGWGNVTINFKQGVNRIDFVATCNSNGPTVNGFGFQLGNYFMPPFSYNGMGNLIEAFGTNGPEIAPMMCPAFPCVAVMNGQNYGYVRWNPAGGSSTTGYSYAPNWSNYNNDNSQGRPIYYNSAATPGNPQSFSGGVRFGTWNAWDIQDIYVACKPSLVPRFDHTKPLLPIFIATSGYQLPDVDQTIQTLQAGHYQGFVLWDVEGYPGTTNMPYVGDPRYLHLFNPSVDAVIDAWVAKIVAAGFTPGFTIRAAIIRQDGNGNYYQDAGDNSLGSVQNICTDITAKIQYAQQRWGAKLFYIDSTAGFWSDPYRAVMKACPTAILMPEITNNAEGWYSVGMPFMEVKDAQWQGGWGNILNYYPSKPYNGGKAIWADDFDWSNPTDVQNLMSCKAAGSLIFCRDIDIVNEWNAY